MKRILTLLLVGVSLITSAQERCGTEAYTKNLKKNNSSYAIALDKVNSQTEKWIKNHPYHREKTIITIPVVVHVVWKTNTENISDAQIFSQIDVLNKDFRRLNHDTSDTPPVWQSIAADSEIEFCLATTDPNGNITTGITRTETDISEFTYGNWGSDDLKDTLSGGINAWPNNDYLNIWVCNLETPTLGYATFPSNVIDSKDGIVVGCRFFGTTGALQSPFNKGRTATHEVGHWLGLRHIWGDNNCGNDNINDTPEHQGENGGCPNYPHNANSCQPNNAFGEMFMNYMDYTGDACMNLFTNGQKTRMLAAINQYRSNLLSHNLCSGSVGISEQTNNKKKLIKIVDVLGRMSTEKQTNTPLFYIYDNGSVEKKMIIE
jgi:hypothetical protein